MIIINIMINSLSNKNPTKIKQHELQRVIATRDYLVTITPEQAIQELNYIRIKKPF
jgi:hypothetical protein